MTNSVTIRDDGGAGLTNYPLRLGRPFLMGEIMAFPQVVQDGVPLHTQADVKTRWPDGSVRHAILSCIIPSVPPDGAAVLTFRNQGVANTNGAEDATAMLSGRYDFDAGIDFEFTNGVTASVSAREMIANGDFTYWLNGDVATSVILADHSAARIYDVGSDGNRSVRPIFHVTFWPALSNAEVRFIGEIADTEALQNQSYAFDLLAGNGATLPWHSNTGILHLARSRWTKSCWLKQVPPALSFDWNLEYLAATRQVPNYDVSRHPGEEAVTKLYGRWTNAATDIFEPGNWTKQMDQTGGRPDIGPYPEWVSTFLYNGDARLLEVCAGNADLAAAWPMHYREGDATKHMNEGESGLGRVMAVTERPSFYGGNLDNYYTKAADKVVPVGPYSTEGWYADNSHQPDPYSVLYLLRGDYWYLEQMQFWAAYGIARVDGASNTQGWGRGPTGAEGGLYDQIRGQGWCFRNRVETAAYSPDGTPEKTYFTRMVNDAIAVWEGARNISNTANYGNACWTWANQTVYESLWKGIGPPPTGQWNRGNEREAGTSSINTNVVSMAMSPWMQGFLMYSLGRGFELGYPTIELIRFGAEMFTEPIVNDSLNPYVVGAYRMPSIRRSDTNYFTWNDMITGYADDYNLSNKFNESKGDTSHGYANICIPAMAAATVASNGLTAWRWLEGECLTNALLDENPKWCILPRITNEPGGASFQLTAFALTNRVVLRWPRPTACQNYSDSVLIHAATGTYPAATNEGVCVYVGTDQTCTHTGATPGTTYFYTIWTSDDEGVSYGNP
jgi:hypothetical protein